jgi:hypothetical protein
LRRTIAPPVGQLAAIALPRLVRTFPALPAASGLRRLARLLTCLLAFAGLLPFARLLARLAIRLPW